MSDTFTVNYNGKIIELPILKSSYGNDVVDIRNIYQKLGLFSYDPGFTSTASCSSAITYIDGEKGELMYRGYSIEDIVENCDFLEVAYLLINGEIPNKNEVINFKDKITSHTLVNEQMKSVYQGFFRNAHPMAIMVGVVGALSSFYHDSLDINDSSQREIAIYRLIAKMPTLAGMAYNYSIGRPLQYPDNSLGYSENLLNMMFNIPSRKYKVDPVFAKALDKFLILHADHEQNASTSTVRIASSSKANPFACIASGIASLWGPAHGGANQEVINMLNAIGTKDRIKEFVKKAKDKDDPFRLMGFGHRVYKNYDPRAKILKKACYELLEVSQHGKQNLFKIALELEKIALEDDYFVEKKLYPNVDFYSGLILTALGMPVSMFTVIFAIARTAGWVAQWKEMIEDPEQKISRPRQLYIGKTLRKINR